MSQQLVKKDSDGRYSNVMPNSWIEAIKDKSTGQTLVEILQGFNMYFLSYNGNTSATRCSVPKILRKKGLWITYVKYDGNVYTEWYAANEIDDKSWGDNSNWRIGNNTLVGDITISANGNWVINGTETAFKAVGEKGNTPLIRVANNRLQVSYDLGNTYRNVTENPVYTQFRNYNNKIQVSTDLGATWVDASDEIAAYFRWQVTTKDTQANNVGRLQISRDNKTWTNLSNDIINNLHISKYIGANEPLPTSGIAEGTIYAKGPTYAVEDTSNSNPIYRLWVYAWKGNTLAWQDNGEFTSIAAGIVQETGSNENAVMSQKATSAKFTELEQGIIYDVSAHNDNAVFESLSALLSSPNLSTLIPTSVRHGGMSIRFIQGSEQSSDNKYIQARCIANEFITDIAKWQGIDNEIIVNSKNLAESGAVAKYIQDAVDKYLPTKEWVQVTQVEKTDGKAWVSDGADGITLSEQSNRTAVKFAAIGGVKYYVQGYNTGTSSSYSIYFLNNAGKIITGTTINNVTSETIEENNYCVQFTTPLDCASVAYTAYQNSNYDLQKNEINASIEKQQSILNLTDVKYLNEAVKDLVYTTVNLYNSEDVNTDKEINKYGELVVSQGKAVTNYIPMESVFTFTYITQGPPILCAFYDKDKRFISFLKTSSATLIDNSYYIIYLPSGTKYVRVAYRESGVFKKICPWFYPSNVLDYNQTATRTISEELIPNTIQKVEDNNLNTENKTIPGAINEVNNSYSKNTLKEAYLHEVKGEFLLDEDWFEKGNISFNSDTYIYGTNDNRIRTKRNVFIRLEKGDKICKKDKYISINCGYIMDDGKYQRVTDKDSEENIICKYSGNYMLVFLYPDSYAVGEVSDLLKKIYIVRKEQAIPSIIEYNKDEIEKLLALSCNSYPNTDIPSTKQKRRRFASLIMTDIHGDADRVKRFIQLYNTVSKYVDLGINLGDIPSTVWNAEGDIPTWYTDIVAKCKNNIWGAIGNHEINGAESIGLERLTSQEAFEKFIAPLNLGLETSTPYYAKRFEDYGVTAIVLNCYDWPDGTYPYGTNTWIICQTQFDWLVKVLTNVPANDTVAIFMHSMGKTLVPDNSAFSSTMVDNKGNRILPANWYDAYFSACLFGIIDAWQNHTSFSYNQVHEDISVSINVDFTSRSEGKFAGFFVGHEHMDMVGHVNNYPNQNMFCLNSSSVDKVLTGDLVRNLGQKNEDALTAITIDTHGRKVHLLRFGANFTINGELRSYASYTY